MWLLLLAGADPRSLDAEWQALDLSAASTDTAEPSSTRARASPDPLPEPARRFVAACDQALQASPADPLAPTWLARSGEVLYRYGHLAGARDRLARAVALDPTAERPVMLLLDAMNLLGEHAALERTVTDLLARRAGSDDLRRQLRDIAVAVAFRRVSEGDATEPAAVAEQWLAIARAYPDHPRAGLALTNAAMFAQRAGHPEEALALRRQALAIPTDDWRLEASNRQSIAFADELAGRRADAAAGYEALAALLADHRPSADRDLADAVYNAAILRDRLGQRDAALRRYSELLGLAPDDRSAPEVRARIAELRAAQ